MQTIIIVKDGQAISFTYNELTPDLDFEAAVKAAAEDYLHTVHGYIYYVAQKKAFTWTDVVSALPAYICERHGFKPIVAQISNKLVNADDLVIDMDTIKQLFEKQQEKLNHDNDKYSK